MEGDLDAGWLGRQGVALALHSASDVLRTKDLPVVMTFLISRALVGFALFFIFCPLICTLLVRWKTVFLFCENFFFYSIFYLLQLASIFHLWQLVALIFPCMLLNVQADPNADVRGRMINAGIMIIDKHGRENVSLLFPIFENYLNKKVVFLFDNIFYCQNHMLELLSFLSV